MRSRVKMFSGYDEREQEDAINKWLRENHTTTHVKNIMRDDTKGAFGIRVAHTIWYEDIE